MHYINANFEKPTEAFEKAAFVTVTKLHNLSDISCCGRRRHLKRRGTRTGK